MPIYVGRSEHTDRLRITAEGLQDGAYRIVSGDGWLVLIGQDTESTPIEPWARNNANIVSGKLQREWDQITGAFWGVPQATLYKNRFTLPGDTGWPDDQRKAGQELAPLEMWGFDERGTFNAVCGTLGKVEMDKLRGSWRDSMLLARGDTLRAADRKAEALAAYKSILAEDSGDPRLRKVAEEKIKALAGRQP